MTTRILFAGFGGQGVLFSGKLLAYIALAEEKQLSWLPSYGPEMRGGTANCSVTIADEPIGSPIIDKPDILVAMNLPSLEKFEGTVKPGGMIFVESTLIAKKVERDDVKVFYVPATKMAQDMGAPTLANMVITGKLIKESGVVDFADVEKALGKIISARHADMLATNKQAIQAGYDF